MVPTPGSLASAKWPRWSSTRARLIGRPSPAPSYLRASELSTWPNGSSALGRSAAAVANGVYIGACNRVGSEGPWNVGRFYGSSYVVNPRGKILRQASEDKDELVVADMDLDMVREVRDLWQFFRDRRPETYGDLTNPGR